MTIPNKIEKNITFFRQSQSQSKKDIFYVVFHLKVTAFIWAFESGCVVISLLHHCSFKWCWQTFKIY